MAGTVTIYHNPKCSKSAAVLAILRESGREVTVVPYLEDGWSAGLLERLMQGAGLRACDLLRADEPRAVALGLNEPDVKDARIIAEMLVYPELVQRPIVETEKGVRLCRPPERVLEIL